ncbi:hypothetical protein MSG28_003163 [Choristoneura fumiferana]|uniref:Uncharacterized protein n=1 Tax=Choristoneura fumiferana TaxID=7141 RepID=A0ACC0KEI7_CHOFU|nr:hypothetical protein MSG28_003163 [Choristoneura fumiferana]
MSGRSDCRKFAPNIFNKSKCTNCFRQKEEHSAEALESNRITIVGEKSSSGDCEPEDEALAGLPLACSRTAKFNKKKTYTTNRENRARYCRPYAKMALE